MTIVIHTKTPQKLLMDIRTRIDEGEEHSENEGVIKGWKYDKDGDFYHIKDEWMETLWLKAETTESGLKMRVVSPVGKKLSAAILGHRQGQFAGMLLTHFAGDFEGACLIP